MTGPKVVGSIQTDVPPTTEVGKSQSAADRPTKPLPTDRVGLAKQFELLRGFAAITSQGKSVVGNGEAADLIKIHPNTSVLAMPFFLDVGFLKREGTGYVVAPDVMSYVKAVMWNADTAAYKLAPLLSKTWFADALLPKLRMGKPISEREAIELLAAASGAGPRYEGQLKSILNYLVQSGLVKKDGDSYRDGALQVPEETPTRSEQVAPDEETRNSPIRDRGSSLSTAFSQAPEGVLRFNVDVSVDLKDFATWQPDRIAAFWSGIAQVLAAKANVEQEAKR